MLLSQVFSNANQEKLFHPSTGYMKWEQQAKQVIPDVLLSRNAFQFLLRDPKDPARYIISRAGSGSTSGSDGGKYPQKDPQTTIVFMTIMLLFTGYDVLIL